MHIPTKMLNDRCVVPAIGFGTFSLQGATGVRAVDLALKNNYRWLDTAFTYENEGTVGRAIAQSSVPREEIIITSKLPGRCHEYEKAVYTIQESLYRANLDYFDFYLIHWPNPKHGKYVEAWQALIDAQKWGLIRSIGVSNFLPEHIEVLENETGILPSINQIEMHPYLNNRDLLKYNQSKGIQTQSWSPIGNRLVTELSSHPLISKMGAKYEKSITQIILRWHIQLGSIPIPSSRRSAHQLENISIFDFELTDEEMVLIDSLTKPDGHVFGQEPNTYHEY